MRTSAFVVLALTLPACLPVGGGSSDVPEDAGSDATPAQTDGGTSVDGEATAADAAQPTRHDAAQRQDAAPQFDEGVVPEGAPAGSACTVNEDCRGGTCMLGPEWPEGYCTGDCDPSCGFGVCSGFGNFCAARCLDQSNCRAGYACIRGLDGNHACLPDPEAMGDDRVDGEGCDADARCRGGTCIEDWPAGYCTTVGCETFMDCASDGENNRCLIQRGGQNFCVRICGGPEDCRPGYLCQQLSRDTGACLPNPNTPFLPPEEVAAHPLGIECAAPSGGNGFALPYSIDEGTTAYMVVPFTASGEVMQPQRIERPGGQISFGNGPNAFQAAPAQLFGGINPTLVPGHAGLAGDLAAGAHTYQLAANGPQVCHYLLEESSPGTVIDLNIYLVGLPGVSAANAAADPNLTAVLDRFSVVYAQAEVGLGRVRYFDMPPDVTEAYQIIRGPDDVGALLERTRLPGETRDEALSLNVAFTRQFAFANGQGVLGVSMGLPGPAGLHGTRTSGVVFTAEFLGREIMDGGGTPVDGNVYIGNILGHEVGHYLGLFHTSEQDGRGFDPLGDTPECRNGFPAGCPDLDNLMFPLARAGALTLSPLQVSTVRNNPLTKEPTP